ncbi:serine/threonine-protein kinase [Spirilliplanes yamanashiensis]|uniref:non-specific serine/threonine protein kinase n=1 Tax=Spirilliplanes yamanashiensis TaxID=42233 RepID=A0A8J3Y6Z9_9ACTN|nr:serine/threonine-protein kinase [Spirilliplanes yamanashiensis]MDP9815018.1 serine/threonine-protein kinase [Spirilliplanes yamanashiensis]GIJ02674.1 putative serine/threonine-protein kinase PknA [Spirilliplanes yamanashiensis]
MISPGVSLGGRYRLDERIAGGGMGDVWRGTDEVLGRTVAVKILLPALLDEPGFAERFRGEARTMATVNHPGVVDVYDYGSDQQIAFLVMEYVEGDALSRTLNRVGRLTPARTMALIAQAADALEAAHAKGIVHRDVKPGNLLVRPNGTLVLTDFGIARSALVGQLTMAGAVLGTASYISPEQASGNVATSASDVYALGVVAYQCLSGHRPFDGDTPIEIAMKHVRDSPRPLPADIPPAVRQIVERAMAKEPAARWPSAAALAAVARQAAATLTSTVHVQAGLPHQGATAVPPHAQNGANRPQSGPPRTYPQQPVSPPRPPLQQPGVPRPVSGAQQARGAASVPSTGGPTYNRPSAPPLAPPARRPEGSGSRQVLIVVAVVLAILVLLCAGVISFLYRTNQGQALVDVGGGGPAVASYRVMEQLPLTIEGRRTP